MKNRTVQLLNGSAVAILVFSTAACESPTFNQQLGDWEVESYTGAEATQGAIASLERLVGVLRGTRGENPDVDVALLEDRLALLRESPAPSASEGLVYAGADGIEWAQPHPYSMANAPDKEAGSFSATESQAFFSHDMDVVYAGQYKNFSDSSNFPANAFWLHVNISAGPPCYAGIYMSVDTHHNATDGWDSIHEWTDASSFCT